MVVRSKQPADPTPGDRPVRFEATVHPGPRQLSLEAFEKLDVDRLPDVDGELRVLVTGDDARRLVEAGYEVHLLAAVPVGPLDPSLVMDDKRAFAWIEERLHGIKREGRS